MTVQPRRVTASDVARAAGVGKTTVSYVLNATPNQTIPESTRQRVIAAAELLNYTPMSAARALRKGRNDMVLAILPDWQLARVVSVTLEHLSDELEKHGLTLIIRRAHGESSIGRIWRELMPAAVIAFGDVDDAEQEAMRANGLVVASVFRYAQASSTDAIFLPQQEIGAMQVRHLTERGHRRIGYALPLDDHLGVGALRADGASNACADLGLEEIIRFVMEPELASAVRAAQHWVASDVTAVAAFNDEIALALLAGMRALGMVAPDDLAVIGVDNEPLGRFIPPPLSTVDVNTALMAQIMTRAVVDGMEGKQPREHIESQAISLVIREST